MMLVGTGVGAFLATAVLSFTIGRRRGLVLLLTGLVSGLSPVLLSFSTEMPAAVGGATVMGESQAVFMAVSAVLLQEVVPDDVRGRVMSFYLMSAGGGMALANLGFASLADLFGAPALLLVPGLAFVALLGGSGIGASSLRSIIRRGTMGQTTLEQASAALPT